MKMTQLRRLLSVILCTVLIAATALMAIGCGNGKDVGDETKSDVIEQPNLEDDEGGETVAEGNNDGETTAEAGAKVLGEGKNKFDFNVVDLDGKVTQFVIHTDKEIVGDALVELGLIEGDAGPYGLYVKKVNGIVADYDKDKTYWGFYVDGDYAMTGVDMTKIEEGKVYSFKVSK